MNFVGSIPRGRAGMSGFTGASGASGSSGYSGYSGISGFSGYSGKSGYSGFAPSGPVLVQQKTATGADGSAGITATFDTPLVAGNSVIASISFVNVGAPGFDNVPTLVGGGGAPLIITTGSTVTGVDTYIYYLHNVTGGETALSFSMDTPVRASVNVSEWRNLANLAPVDTDANSALASATVTTNSVTPTHSTNLIIAVGGWTANNYLSGPINSFTRLTATGGGAAFQESAYLLQSSIAATSTGWTLSVGVNWCAAIAAFDGV